MLNKFKISKQLHFSHHCRLVVSTCRYITCAPFPEYDLQPFPEYDLQPNFNGSNTFGTMKIRSRPEQFELMNVDHSAMTGDMIGLVFSSSSNLKICCVFSRRF